MLAQSADKLLIDVSKKSGNPLPKKPLKLAHIKPRLLGQWGTTPGLNFVYWFTRIAGRLSSPTAGGRNHAL